MTSVVGRHLDCRTNLWRSCGFYALALCFVALVTGTHSLIKQEPGCEAKTLWRRSCLVFLLRYGSTTEFLNLSLCQDPYPLPLYSNCWPQFILRGSLSQKAFGSSLCQNIWAPNFKRLLCQPSSSLAHNGFWWRASWQHSQRDLALCLPLSAHFAALRQFRSTCWLFLQRLWYWQFGIFWPEPQPNILLLSTAATAHGPLSGPTTEGDAKTETDLKGKDCATE